MRFRIPYWPFLLGPTILFYLGALMNVGIMAVNHGQMPVHVPPALLKSVVELDPRHCIMTSNTRLKFFCDWIDLGDEGVASPGDILIWFHELYNSVSLAIWSVLMIKDFNNGV